MLNSFKLVAKVRQSSAIHLILEFLYEYSYGSYNGFGLEI
jgi:hypothetical protein